MEDKGLESSLGPDPGKFTDALCRFGALGFVANTWAAFERTIDIYTLEIGGIKKDPGLCLTTQILGSGKKLEAYIAVVKLRCGDIYSKELEIFWKDTQKLQERRNRLIDDQSLIFRHIKKSRFELTAARKFRQEAIEENTDTILKFADYIFKHDSRLTELHDEIFASLSA